jgi:hypothetical protein
VVTVEDKRLRGEHRRGQRAVLLRRFAVLDEAGAPVCHDEEGWWSPDRGSAGKVILVSQCYARRLAGALAALGEDPQEEYICGRGHWHLRDAAKRRERNAYAKQMGWR